MADIYLTTTAGYTTTGGNGQPGQPYGTVAEMLSGEGGAIPSGSRLIINTDLCPIFETLPLTNVVGLRTISGGSARYRVRRVARPTSLVAETDGTFDVLQITGTYAADPIAVLRDFESYKSGKWYERGICPEGTGGDFATQLAFIKENDGHWARDGTDLYVSVPKGNTNIDHEFYIALAGDLVSIGGTCSDIYLRQGDFAISLETGNQVGNGIDIAATVSDVLIEDCSIQWCQFHHAVTRGGSTRNVRIRKCDLGYARGSNDGIVTFYSATGELSGCIAEKNHVRAYALRDTAGNTFDAGSIKSFGHHSNGDQVQAGGVIFQDNRIDRDPLNLGFHSPDLSVTAGGLDHAEPVDLADEEQYPLIYRDNVGSGAMSLGGGASLVLWAAIVRNSCSGDFSTVPAITGGIGGNGLGHIGVITGTGSTTGILFESNAVSMLLNDINNRSIMSFSNGTGGTIVRTIGQNSFYLRGTYTNEPCIIMSGSTLDDSDTTFVGNVLGSDSDIQPVRGNEDMEAAGWNGNIYGDNLNANFQVSGASLVKTRTTWQATVDPNGIYDQPVVFNEAEGVAYPNRELAAQRTTVFESGPVGVNQRPYDRRFGAYQFGPFRYSRASRRSYSRNRGQRGSLKGD